MARIRTIKPDFFKNEQLADLPMTARLLFIGLWTLADKEGRLEDRPKRIKVELFPYDNLDCDKELARLQNSGFIIRYEVGEMKVIKVLNFTIHQRITGKESESESKFPDYVEVKKQLGSNGETSGKHLGEQEGNRKEGNGKGNDNTPIGVSSTSSPANRLPRLLKDGLKEEWIEISKEISESTDSTTQKKLLQKFIVLKKPNFIEPYATAWNMMAFENNFSEINMNGLSDKRINQLKTRLKESAFDFMRIMWSIPRNPKYKEAIGDKNWKVDFDYVIKNDTNYLKIIEGVPNRDAYDVMIHKMLG